MMKRGYFIGLALGCAVLMLGCANQEKDQANDPDAPAITDNTGLTEGAADVAGQDSSQTKETSDPAGQSGNAGEGTTDKAGQTADVTGQTAVATGKNTDSSDTTSADQTKNRTGSSGKTSANETNKKTDSSGKTATNETNKKTGSSDKTSANKKKTQVGSASQPKEIGIEAAKKIALTKAGLTEQDGSWKEEKRDREDGRIVYELEFVSGKIEYEFEIDAQKGTILEYQQDPIDD